MITSLFKNTGFSYLIILIVSTTLWLIEIYSTATGELTTISISNQSISINRLTALFLAFFITIVGGGYINYRFQTHLFGYENSHLFFLFYVLFVSLGLHSDLILQYSLLSFSILLFTDILIVMVDKQEKENSAFNASFLIGILVLHNFIFSLLIVFVLIALSTLRSIKRKDIGLIILGLFFPFLYIIFFTLLTENLDHFGSILSINWHLPAINWKNGILLFFIIFLSITGRNLFIKNRFGVELSIYKLTDLLTLCLYFLLLISALSLFIFKFNYVLYILAIPLSVFLVKYFINSTYRFKEIVLVLLVFILILS